MITQVKVPRISANVNEVTITEWFKKEGDTIKEGESLVEMTTEKAAFDFESPCSGVVRRVVAQEKSVIPTGYIVALIGGPADVVPDVTEANEEVLQKYRSAARVKKKVKREPGRKKPSSTVKATPAARRYAREQEIDLAGVAKTCDGDTVVTRDMVEEYARTQGG